MQGLDKKKDGLKAITNMIRAHYSLIHIPTSEEGRLLTSLSGWFGKSQHGTKRSLYVWTYMDGLKKYGARSEGGEGDDTTILEAALDKVLAAPKDAGNVYAFLDFHHHTEEPGVLRRLRECAHQLRVTDNVVLLVSPSLHVPDDLEKEMAVADFPLPDKEEIKEGVVESLKHLKQNPRGYKVDDRPELVDEVVQSASGLTLVESQDALARGIIEHEGFVEGIVESMNSAKQDVLRKVGFLEAIHVGHGMEEVGGLDYLKGWVKKRHKIFTPEARKFGLDYPKGILTLGVPGGGKGLSARAVAAEWRLPLLRLDIGAVFGGIVGESESNLRKALRIAEALSPVVLWVDELEKALGGASGYSGDSGTTKRVFGTFLTWLQEREKPVFSYFTANDISSLPPELLRKGRVDEIFFIDLPNQEERVEILRIHLQKRDRNPEGFDLERAASAGRGFVGAEIEQIVVEAMVDAFYEKRDVKTEDLVKAFGRTTPMVKTQRDQISRLLDFVREGRAVRASSGQPEMLGPEFYQGKEG